MNNTLVNFIKNCIRVFFFLSVIGVVLGLVASILGFTGLLPSKFYASYEVPITLNKLEQLYDLKSLGTEYSDTHIEIKKASLEIKPTNGAWHQGLMYLYTTAYLFLLAFVLWLLMGILKSVSTGNSFARENYKRIRNIGFVIILFSLFEPIIYSLVGSAFMHLQEKLPELINISSVRFELDFTEIIFGLLILVLAEVFRQGTELQELENLTI